MGFKECLPSVLRFQLLSLLSLLYAALSVLFQSLQCQEPATEVQNRKSPKVLRGVLQEFNVLLRVLGKSQSASLEAISYSDPL